MCVAHSWIKALGQKLLQLPHNLHLNQFAECAEGTRKKLLCAESVQLPFRYRVIAPNFCIHYWLSIVHRRPDKSACCGTLSPLCTKRTRGKLNTNHISHILLVFSSLTTYFVFLVEIAIFVIILVHWSNSWKFEKLRRIGTRCYESSVFRVRSLQSRIAKI